MEKRKQEEQVRQSLLKRHIEEQRLREEEARRKAQEEAKAAEALRAK